MSEERDSIASLRIERSRTTGCYTVVLDTRDKHMEPPIAFATINGLLTFAADIVAEEMHSRVTETALPPIDPRALVT